VSFKTDFAAVLKRAGDKADLVVRKSAIDLGKSLIQMSPVDTGRFRGNWQFGISAIDQATNSPPDQGGGTTNGRLVTKIGSWRWGEIIYLTNSLAYARRLEYGWSKQAPAGMVRITVANFERHLQNQIKGLS
jgi:hypothetical protein